MGDLRTSEMFSEQTVNAPSHEGRAEDLEARVKSGSPKRYKSKKKVKQPGETHQNS